MSNATVKLRINMEIMDMGEADATAQGSSSGYSATFPANQTFTMGGAWVVQVEIDRPNQSPVHLAFQVLITA